MTLPTFTSVCRRIAAAEDRDGWLVECDEAAKFLVPCRELIDSLASTLDDLDAGPVVEVCAGPGDLAAALVDAGVEVIATDDAASDGSGVLPMAAGEALARYRPQVVLGAFVPFDAGVDEAVLDFPTVRHYVVLGARLGGQLGSAGLWRRPGWAHEPLEGLNRWLLTRHDVWTGDDSRPILQHGEAWHFRRELDRSIDVPRPCRELDEHG